MNRYRSLVVAGVVAASTLSFSIVRADTPGAHSFDFLVGEWSAHHRRLLPDGSKWVEFDGTLSNRKLLDGSVNIEELALDAPTGAYHAIGLRAFDAKSGNWSIWWLDQRYLSNGLGQPVVGHFESDGNGRFYADYEQNGKPMRGRFLWSEITPDSARWEQSSSGDSGKTWQPNWIFKLKRTTAQNHYTKMSNVAAARANDGHDFDFLFGDWRVHHRFLRTNGEWQEMEGTVINRPAFGGNANVEEHTFNGAKGRTYGLGLRSYDPKTSQWSIWWLDSRAPDHIDAPMQGHWEKGVGTFYGTATLNDKTLPARLTWSNVTKTSAHWEQAYSFDGGKTWQTNWVMEFERTARLTSP